MKGKIKIELDFDSSWFKEKHELELFELAESFEKREILYYKLKKLLTFNDLDIYYEKTEKNKYDDLSYPDAIVATYGFNSVLKKPFEFLYDFGYYTQYGCVVYNHGERNMQDAHAFELEKIRIATLEDLKEYTWGN